MTLRSGNPLWILGVIATGLVSIHVPLTGFCPVGSGLRLLGFTPMLGLAVGINICVASILVLTYSAWFTLFTGFVGSAMVWFAATGFCAMANGLYWLGAAPRLAPESLPAAGCTECPKSDTCLGGHPILARGEEARRIEPLASALIGVQFAAEERAQ